MRKKYDSNVAGAVDIWTTYNYFIQRLKSIAISCFDWDGLPDTVRQRQIELSLIRKGKALFYYDEIAEAYLAMRCVCNGPFDVYDEPVHRRAYADNGYQYDADNTNSVLIWDNYLHEDIWIALSMFAKRLTNIELTKDINLRAQKTPVMILCDDRQRLTMENLFMKIDMYTPVIFGSKNLDIDSVKVLNLEAPYLVDKLQEEKVNVLHEAFSFLGVGSLEIIKRERLISQEMQASQESNIAQRANRLKAREEAARLINQMYGLDVSVKYSPVGDQIADNMLIAAARGQNLLPDQSQNLLTDQDDAEVME